MKEGIILEVSHLRVAVGDAGVPVIDDLSFSLTGGKTLAVVGDDGSGASLTALAIMGLLPDGTTWEGTIHMNAGGAEKVFRPETPGDAWTSVRGMAVGMVFRSPADMLDPLMTVGRQMTAVLSAHNSYDYVEAKRAATDWFRKVQLPDPEAIYHRYPHELSAAQVQRVAIAMAMSAHPAILIAAEPTISLDMFERQEILRLLRAIQHEFNTGIIVFTDDPAFAAGVADDIVVLHDGRVVAHGPVDGVLGAQGHPHVQALLACRPGSGTRGYRLPVPVDFSDQVTVPDKEPLPQVKPLEEVLLAVRHLRVWFPAQADQPGAANRVLRAVEDVSFDLKRGEVLGMIGEHGSGKSTIARALVGGQPVESGQMIIDGKDLARLTVAGWRSMRRRVQMISGDCYRSLNPRMTIGETLREPLLAHRVVPRREISVEVERLINLVQLPAAILQQYPEDLTRVAYLSAVIARSLALRPSLMICDDCISVLDMAGQAVIINLIKLLQAQLNLSYLFISHDLDVVSHISDSILVMRKGKVIGRGPTDEVLKNPKTEYTKRLMDAAALI